MLTVACAAADIAQVAVNKLVDTIRNRPAPFINLIQAGLSEDLVNALKFGIPANATIFGGDFSGIPALPGPISSALQILLSSKIKIATLQSADSLVRDFFQVMHVCSPNLIAQIFILGIGWRLTRVPE